MRLLLLEDDPALRAAYASHLRTDGYAVDEVDTLAAARRRLDAYDHDCLVLDRMVPDGDALDLVAEVTSQPGAPPVVVLSGIGGTDARIQGLEAGAHDYVVKPVRVRELLLRIRRVAVVHSPVGRDRTAPAETVIDLGPVHLDRHRGQVFRHGRPLHLTPHQYAVFEMLAVRRGSLVLSQDLLDQCWDREANFVGNPLHSQVSRLRSMFRGVLAIRSVRGQGYRLVVKDPEPTATVHRFEPAVDVGPGTVNGF